jgi:hypothetical protein
VVTVNNQAINDLGAANVTAIGGAVVTNDSSATVNNVAEATGPGSSASATGFAEANNHSVAEQSATAIASGGADAIGQANALACPIDPTTGDPLGAGCTSIALANAEAEKGADLAFAEADAISLNGGRTFAESNQFATGQGSAAGGAAVSVANGEDNLALSFANGEATDGGKATTGSIAGSNVGPGQYGIGVAKSVSCTDDQVSCGTGFGVALASGSQGGIAVADSTASANGQNATGIAGAEAGSSCTGPASASFTVNSDGSFNYSAGFNSGFGCASASSGTSELVTQPVIPVAPIVP